MMIIYSYLLPVLYNRRCFIRKGGFLLGVSCISWLILHAVFLFPFPYLSLPFLFFFFIVTYIPLWIDHFHNHGILVFFSFFFFLFLFSFFFLFFICWFLLVGRGIWKSPWEGVE
ncbi:uncharacterized protein BP01DRAFT_63632 [Aspergillus saccharolyticus JOP 1030-1]|uniref:Uncharacterized protein n=1 Tax=Aspergillus saccharolyticus JOP 1030-1 TaxID=1450539 RepID=A0A318ZC53_9EURO|nr:hypothetical protein BP01DRAFT_63632 [Aspergillus saccharolyticus JOP 1030-1]PYH44996.1 hypothetical protein BP01DRAFT_63632 [Aspergillus saccharolyticus JOP 1030-1]